MPDTLPLLDASIATIAVLIALWLRPWRGVGANGPPWLWLAAWAMVPLLWGVERYIAVPIAQPMSGATALVLLAGWPLAVLACVPAAVVTAMAAHLDWLEALHRCVWLGMVPATLALVIGAALRRWLPHQLFVYILGRGFFGAFAASLVAGSLAIALLAAPEGASSDDLFVAQILVAFGEAFLTGMLTAILVAFRPQWLATYTDRLYLPRPPDAA